jgi:predicted metal-dependent phosphoesterase TrpH
MSASRGSFAIDFHVHTTFSFDSVTPPKLAIEVARRRGLSGIAVTDHDTIAGAIATAEANRYADFLVVPGIEVKSDLGDIIGLYLRREIQSRSFADVIAEIHEQGGIAYLPHPIRTFGPDVPKVHASYPQIELWERYNGRYSANEFRRADEAFERLAIGPALCGSDAHFPWEVGLLRTVFDYVPRTAAELTAAASRAALVAEPRNELPLRAGIALGEATKMLKSKNYAKFAMLVASLPWRACRRSARLVAGAALKRATRS